MRESVDLFLKPPHFLSKFSSATNSLFSMCAFTYPGIPFENFRFCYFSHDFVLGEVKLSHFHQSAGKTIEKYSVQTFVMFYSRPWVA